MRSINNWKIIEGEFVFDCPAWVSFLFELGGVLARESFLPSVMARTVVLCLPKIEYAPVFLSLGILFGERRTNSIPKEVPGGITNQWTSYLGQNVIIQCGNPTADPNDPKKEIIQIREVTGQLISVNNEKVICCHRANRRSSGMRIEIMLKNIFKVLLCDGVRPQRRKIEKKLAHAELIDLLRIVIGEETIQLLELNKNTLIYYNGVQTQFREECCSLELIDRQNHRFPVTELINLFPENNHISFNVEDKNVAKISIVEGTRMQEINLMKNGIQIILLSRDSFYYDEAFKQVENFYQQRAASNFTIDLIPPVTIGMWSFYNE